MAHELSAYSHRDGEIGTGLQVVGVLDGEPVTSIDVFASERAVNRFIGHNAIGVSFEGLPKGRIGYLGGIELDEKLRGQGLGSRLVGMMLDETRRLKIHTVALLSERPAESFWQRIGFRPNGPRSQHSYVVPMTIHLGS